VDSPVIAQAAGNDRIGADLVGGAQEQRIRFRVTAEVGFLKRLIGEAFGPTQGRDIAGVADSGEEFRGFGLASGIVAAIGFGERL
jgi:hypothetical protein